MNPVSLALLMFVVRLFLCVTLQSLTPRKRFLIGMPCAHRSRLASAGQVAKGLACNPTAQALCVAREQQSMTNDYQAVVGPDPVWGKDDRAPPALGSCGRHQLRRTSGNYTECSASAALAEPKLGVGDLACIGTRERPSYKQ